MRMINKTTKRLLILSFLLLLFFSFSVSGFAAASVSFEDSKLIVFSPGSVYTDSDLFESFKGVMPGDRLTEEITIENKNSDFDYIKVYLRAVPHDEDDNPLSENVSASGETVASMQDFLAQLSMQVYKGTSLLFDASPDELDALADNVLLASLRQGESLSLDVVLEVPISLGNEYSDRVGEVDWVFTVEGLDDPVPPTTVKPTEAETTKPDIIKPGTTKPDVPHTGESFNFKALIIGLVLIAAALLLLGLAVRRSKKKNSNG